MKKYFTQGTWYDVEQIVFTLDRFPSIIYNDENIPVGFDFNSRGKHLKSLGETKYIWAYYSTFWKLPNDVNDAFNFMCRLGLPEMTALDLIEKKFGLSQKETYTKYKGWQNEKAVH